MSKVMDAYRISIVGTGYVGLTTAVAFASKGHKVIARDITFIAVATPIDRTPNFFARDPPSAIPSTLTALS